MPRESPAQPRDRERRPPPPAAPAPVTREALEARLAALRAQIEDPRAGLFGPGSMVWAVNKEAVSFLGGGRAALLQLAHPPVAQAIADHSRTRDDPIGRFRRTFRLVFRMVYGDLETAFEAARALHALHDRITGRIAVPAGRFAAGTPYHANDPDALLWVHATLWDTSVLCYEAVVRPLSAAERQRYYEETRRFACLFGIPETHLPADWPAFRRYVDDMLAGDALAVTPAAAEMGRFLFRPLVPGSGPLMRRLAELTAAWLPAHLAAGFGLPVVDPAARRRHEARLRRIARVWPHLPRRVRYLPPYVDARRRVAGRTGPDPVGAFLAWLWIGADGHAGLGRRRAQRSAGGTSPGPRDASSAGSIAGSSGGSTRSTSPRTRQPSRP